MLQAEFFLGYTVSQTGDNGDEALPSSPVLWAGGEMALGSNICFDPASSQVYPWCGVAGTCRISLPSWVDSFLADPIPGSKAWEMLGFFPEKIEEKIEELKDILDEEIELDGEEVLEGYFGKRLLEEISILEEYFQVATGEITLLV